VATASEAAAMTEVVVAMAARHNVWGTAYDRVPRMKCVGPRRRRRRAAATPVADASMVGEGIGCEIRQPGGVQVLLRAIDLHGEGEVINYSRWTFL
jgi:hypothetical protein